MITFACPQCASAQQVPDILQGQEVQCPFCGGSTVCPEASFSVRPVRGSYSTPNQIIKHHHPRRRPMTMRAAFLVTVIAVVVVASAIGGGVFFASRPRPRTLADRDKDQDYLAALEPEFDRQSIQAALEIWNSCTDREWLRGDGDDYAAHTFCEAGFKKRDSCEEEMVAARARFMEKHRIDLNDWRPFFVKNYPEVKLAWDQIRIAARKAADHKAGWVNNAFRAEKTRLQTAVLDHFNKTRNLIVRDMDAYVEREVRGPYADFRRHFLRHNVPKVVEEAIRAGRESREVSRLRRRILGQ
jgi:hypothetical protein